ncbi:NAD(P)-binding protein [Daldinia bambusicola]|nr:NAD(P)-binding protein [Daldinia bambusicola]
MSRVWLITGTSSGFGLELAKVVAARGDRVLAATRNPSKMAPLPGVTVVRLDHNEPLEQIQAAIAEILKIYQTIDVVVNNAAYVQAGTVEGATPEETLRQFQANLFGPINVYRAVLPHMRAKRSGTLVTIGSMSTWYTSPTFNLYNATKAALRRLTLGLAEEVRPFGIRHCLVEPGLFRTELMNQTTNFAGVSADIPDYADLVSAVNAKAVAIHGKQLGDTAKGASIIYDIVTSTGVAASREFPSFVPLGSDAKDVIVKGALDTVEAARQWEDVARLSDSPLTEGSGAALDYRDFVTVEDVPNIGYQYLP